MVRDGFGIADLCAFDGRMFMTNSSRYVYEFDVGDSYDGEPITAYWRTQPTDLGFKHIKKQVKAVLFRGADGVINITVRAGNNKSYDRKNVFAAEDDGFVFSEFRVDQARVFEFLFENEAGGQFGINGGVEVLYETERKP